MGSPFSLRAGRLRLGKDQFSLLVQLLKDVVLKGGGLARASNGERTGPMELPLPEAPSLHANARLIVSLRISSSVWWSGESLGTITWAGLNRVRNSPAWS